MGGPQGCQTKETAISCNAILKRLQTEIREPETILEFQEACKPLSLHLRTSHTCVFHRHFLKENLPKTFEIPVRRGTLFEDSHRAIMSVKNKDHMKARLWVKFDGEVGLDYGGVARYC